MSNTILNEALKLTDGARKDSYGDVTESFENVAAICRIMGINITGKQFAMTQIIHKLVREKKSHKRDNLVDLCGYARLLSILEGEESEEIKLFGEGRCGYCGVPRKVGTGMCYSCKNAFFNRKS